MVYPFFFFGGFMMKHFDIPISIEDQLNLMGKYITVTDDAELLGVLNYAGYFRMSRYGKYLLSYANVLGGRPEQKLLLHLYNLDIRLRNIFFHYCKRAEIQFKNHLANSISIRTGNPVFYLQEDCYTDTKSEKDKTVKIKNKEYFHKTFFPNLRKKENDLRKDVQKYPELKEYRKGGERMKYQLPAWAAFSYFDFGTIVAMYSFLRGDLRKEVLRYGYSSSRYGKSATKQVDTWLDAIRNLRNSCAHHSKLIGKTSSIVLPDRHDDDLLQSDTDLFSRMYALVKILNDDHKKRMIDELNDLVKSLEFDLFSLNILPRGWKEILEKTYPL